MWFLAAVLGAATIYFGVGAVHDTSQGRIAVGLVARTMAEHVTGMAGARLEVLAGPTFAPVAGRSGAAPRADAAVTELVRVQQEGIRCRCRDLLPALAFFYYDVPGRMLRVAPVAGRGDTAVAGAVLVDVVREESQRKRSAETPLVHLRADVRLGTHMIVSHMRLDDHGAPVAVSGLVATTRDLFATLMPHHDAISLAHLDTLSLHVATTDSGPVFGTISNDRHYRGTVEGKGVLDGVAVTVALKPNQIPIPFTVFLPHDRLMKLGVFMLSTIVVLIVAFGSSRRELLLARSRSDFIAGVSHDLRMPLAQILLAGETLALQRERDGKERLVLSSSIVREARRLTALVDNVLFFSRSGAVAPNPHVQPVGIAALFADVVDGVQLAVNDAQQTIEISEVAGLTLLVDRSLIRQAIVNLVDNALKYGKPGQRITLGAEPAGTGRVRLYVDDQGPGVPPAERARVFEAYERLSRDQTSERTGTGLGLAVVGQIARVHGGRAWLEDAPGGGTRAALELPAAERA